MSGYYGGTGGLIYDGIDVLLRNGLIELIIFALIYVVVFGIMQNVGLFASLKPNKPENKQHNADARRKVKKIHTVIALVIAALVLLPHHYDAYSNYDIVPVVEKAVPQVSLMLIAILAGLVLLGMFGVSVAGSKGNPVKFIIFVALIIAVLWFFLNASDYSWWPDWITPEMWAAVIAIVVFGGIVMYIMGDDTKKKKWGDVAKDAEGNPKNWSEVKMMDVLNDMFKHNK